MIPRFHQLGNSQLETIYPKQSGGVGGISTVFHFGFLRASYWCKIWYTWNAGIVSTPNFNVGMGCSWQLSSLKRTAKESFVSQTDTQTTFLLSFGLIFQGLWLAVSFTGFQTHQEPRHKRPCTVMPGDAFAHLTWKEDSCFRTSVPGVPAADFLVFNKSSIRLMICWTRRKGWASSAV